MSYNVIYSLETKYGEKEKFRETWVSSTASPGLANCSTLVQIHTFWIQRKIVVEGSFYCAETQFTSTTYSVKKNTLNFEKIPTQRVLSRKEIPMFIGSAQ